MARGGIKGYYVLLTGAKKILSDDTNESKFSALKLINFTAYNELIIAQVLSGYGCSKANKYGDARLSWTKISKKTANHRGSQ